MNNQHMASTDDAGGDLLDPDNSSNIGVCFAITRQRSLAVPLRGDGYLTFQESISCRLSIDSKTILFAGDLDISIDLELLQSLLEEHSDHSQRFAKDSPLILKLTHLSCPRI